MRRVAVGGGSVPRSLGCGYAALGCRPEWRSSRRNERAFHQRVRVAREAGTLSPHRTRPSWKPSRRSRGHSRAGACFRARPASSKKSHGGGRGGGGRPPHAGQSDPRAHDAGRINQWPNCQRGSFGISTERCATTETPNAGRDARSTGILLGSPSGPGLRARRPLAKSLRLLRTAALNFRSTS